MLVLHDTVVTKIVEANHRLVIDYIVHDDFSVGLANLVEAQVKVDQNFVFF